MVLAFQRYNRQVYSRFHWIGYCHLCNINISQPLKICSYSNRYCSRSIVIVYIRSYRWIFIKQYYLISIVLLLFGMHFDCKVRFFLRNSRDKSSVYQSIPFLTNRSKIIYLFHHHVFWKVPDGYDCPFDRSFGFIQSYRRITSSS